MSITMELINTGFQGLHILLSKVFSDTRGQFIKTYNQTIYKELDIDIEIRERYYSYSHKDVIRGMHFQIPPHDHIKLVNVLYGAIVDVVVDMRASSPMYGKIFSTKIEAGDGKTLIIPSGFAHGFLSIVNNTIVEYNQTTEYFPEYDTGIRYDSIGYDWNIQYPIISERDANFVSMRNFKSPFK